MSYPNVEKRKEDKKDIDLMHLKDEPFVTHFGYEIDEDIKDVLFHFKQEFHDDLFPVPVKSEESHVTHMKSEDDIKNKFGITDLTEWKPNTSKTYQERNSQKSDPEVNTSNVVPHFALSSIDNQQSETESASPSSTITSLKNWIAKKKNCQLLMEHNYASQSPLPTPLDSTMEDNNRSSSSSQFETCNAN